MQEVARAIGIPCLGRNKLYHILRDLRIVDEANRPCQKYVDAALLIRPHVFLEPFRENVWRNRTLIIGKEGLMFIKNTVFDYLKKNPMPKLPHCRKISGGTGI